MNNIKAFGGIFIIYGIGIIMLLTELLGLEKNNIYTIILFVLPIIAIFNGTQNRIRINSTDFFIYIYLIYIFICIFYNINYYMQERLKIFGYILFMMLIPYLLGKNFTIESLKVFKNISYLIFILYSIIIYFKYIFPNFELEYRPVFFGDDSFTARLSEMYSIALIFLLSSVINEKYKLKIYFKILFLIIIYLIVLKLGLKAIFLSVTIVIFYILYGKYYYANIKYFQIYILFFILTSISIIILIAEFQYYTAIKSSINFMNDIINNDFSLVSQYNKCLNIDKNDSIAIRTVLFTDAIGNIIRFPIFGSGPWTFEGYSCWSETGSHPHNIILQSLSELGIIGTAPLILIIFICLQKIKNKRFIQQESNVIIGLFLFYLINVQFNGDIYTNSALFFCIGLLNSKIFLAEQKFKNFQ